jgi:hypothetical protein
MNSKMAIWTIDAIHNEKQKKTGTLGPFGNPYSKSVRENTNLVSESLSLTQLLACSINEKRDTSVKLRTESLEIKREMKEEK